MLYEVDDEPGQLLELIERVPSFPAIELMLRELAGPLSALPPTVRRAVESLFKSPTRARSGAELAHLAGMTRRSLYRHMAIAGLQPRDLIDSAQLLRAYTLLRVPGSRLKQTSAQLGFTRPQALSDLLREWTGLSTRSIHDGIDAATFVRLLSSRILKNSGDAAEPSELLGASVESV